MKKSLLIVYIVSLTGCVTMNSYSIRSGYDSYPPKPEDYEVRIGTKAQEEYSIIGMVFVHAKAHQSEPEFMGVGAIFVPKIERTKVINLLKAEARKLGAEAIFDINITFHGKWADADAKAIIFKSVRNENPEN